MTSAPSSSSPACGLVSWGETRTLPSCVGGDQRSSLHPGHCAGIRYPLPPSSSTLLPRPSSFTVITRKDHADLVDAEVEALQEKGAIEEVSLSSPGFFFFCVQGIGRRPSTSRTPTFTSPSPLHLAASFASVGAAGCGSFGSCHLASALPPSYSPG